jgi:S1-C subfamily serine protease
MTLRLMRAKYKVVQVDPIFFGDVICQEVSVIETRPVEMTFFGPMPRGDIRFIKLNSSGTFTVEKVEKGSAEEAAGLLEGDEIIAIDGTDVRQMASEGEKIMKRRGEPGSTVQLLVKREQKTVTVTLRRSEA